MYDLGPKSLSLFTSGKIAQEGKRLLGLQKALRGYSSNTVNTMFLMMGVL